MDARAIGEKIAKLRKDKEMTQKQLAEQLNLTDQAVSKWENGGAYPDITVLPTLADLLGVTIDELLGCNNRHKQNADTNPYDDANLFGDSELGDRTAKWGCADKQVTSVLWRLATNYGMAAHVGKPFTVVSNC